MYYVIRAKQKNWKLYKMSNVGGLKYDVCIYFVVYSKRTKNHFISKYSIYFGIKLNI